MYHGKKKKISEMKKQPVRVSISQAGKKKNLQSYGPGYFACVSSFL